MSSRFWNRLEFAPAKVLEDLWTERASVDIGPLERFALIVNECANRTLEQRPWGASASRDDALETTHYALANIFYLFSRIIRAGVNQAPLFKALTYCFLISLRHTTPLEVAALIMTDQRPAQRLNWPSTAKLRRRLHIAIRAPSLTAK